MRASFEVGIKAYLGMLAGWMGEGDDQKRDMKAMAVLSTMVGAVLLARAVNDEEMAKQFLKAATESVLAQTTSAANGGAPKQ